MVVKATGAAHTGSAQSTNQSAETGDGEGTSSSATTSVTLQGTAYGMTTHGNGIPPPSREDDARIEPPYDWRAHFAVGRPTTVFSPYDASLMPEARTREAAATIRALFPAGTHTPHTTRYTQLTPEEVAAEVMVEAAGDFPSPSPSPSPPPPPISPQPPADAMGQQSRFAILEAAAIRALYADPQVFVEPPGATVEELEEFTMEISLLGGRMGSLSALNSLQALVLVRNRIGEMKAERQVLPPPTSSRGPGPGSGPDDQPPPGAAGVTHTQRETGYTQPVPRELLPEVLLTPEEVPAEAMVGAADDPPPPPERPVGAHLPADTMGQPSLFELIEAAAVQALHAVPRVFVAPFGTTVSELEAFIREVYQRQGGRVGTLSELDSLAALVLVRNRIVEMTERVSSPPTNSGADLRGPEPDNQLPPGAAEGADIISLEPHMVDKKIDKIISASLEASVTGVFIPPVGVSHQELMAFVDAMQRPKRKLLPGLTSAQTRHVLDMMQADDEDDDDVFLPSASTMSLAVHAMEDELVVALLSAHSLGVFVSTGNFTPQILKDYARYLAGRTVADLTSAETRQAVRLMLDYAAELEAAMGPPR